MGNRFRIVVIGLALVSMAGFVMAGTTPAAPPTKLPLKAPAHHMHGLLLEGTVTSVNRSAKTMIVKNEKGKEVKVSWTEATSFKGGKLATGEKVSIRWIRKDGKNIATAISIAK